LHHNDRNETGDTDISEEIKEQVEQLVKAVRVWDTLDLPLQQRQTDNIRTLNCKENVIMTQNGNIKRTLN